jgi:hypothetical protein
VIGNPAGLRLVASSSASPDPGVQISEPSMVFRN